MLDKLYLRWVFNPALIIIGLYPAFRAKQTRKISPVRFTFEGTKWVYVRSTEIPNHPPLVITYEDLVSKVALGEILLTGVVDEDSSQRKTS